MTQNEHQSRGALSEREIQQLVREAMLDRREIEKNLEQLGRILQLFEEVDAFEKHIEGLEPLYHPLDQLGEPREDKKRDEKVKIEEFAKNIKDRFLRAPRL